MLNMCWDAQSVKFVLVSVLRSVQVGTYKSISHNMYVLEKFQTNNREVCTDKMTASIKTRCLCKEVLILHGFSLIFFFNSATNGWMF